MSWLAELPASENPPIDEFTQKQADSVQIENKYELKRIKNKLYREKKKKQKEELKKEEANADQAALIETLLSIKADAIPSPSVAPRLAEMIIEPSLKRKKSEKKLIDSNNNINNNQDNNEPASKQVKSNQKSQLFKKGDKVLDIMKKSIPISNVEITRDLKNVVDKCACEFIGNITSLAEDICLLDNRNEVTGDDISFALKNLGMENYSDAINMYLTKYREAKALKNSI